MLNNVPEKWDYEADIIAIGSGAGGLAAAITAHDIGSPRAMLEKQAALTG